MDKDFKHWSLTQWFVLISYMFVVKFSLFNEYGYVIKNEFGIQVSESLYAYKNVIRYVIMFEAIPLLLIPFGLEVYKPYRLYRITLLTLAIDVAISLLLILRGRVYTINFIIYIVSVIVFILSIVLDNHLYRYFTIDNSIQNEDRDEINID